MLRIACRDDIPQMHRVRKSVKENVLVSAVISEENYIPYLEEYGRAWVVETERGIVGFAIGDARDGNIWALFVDPNHERLGYGRHLLNAVVAWLWSENLEKLWLTTEANTRAHRFYQSAGWQNIGFTKSGEIRFELYRQK